jgi:hypothetical protein
MIDDLQTKNFECDLIAQDYLGDEPALVSSLDFGSLVAQGCGPGPSVLIGDQSEISLLNSVTAARLDHRMALLARSGDIVLVRHREAGFEAYLADCLGFHDVTFMQVDSDPLRPVAQQVRLSQPMLDALAQTARERGGLTLKAYLTTGNVWRLAQAIGEVSGVRIHVCGPSPRITLRANDKLWFNQLAQKVIGTNATPPTLAAYGPAAAAGLARRIGRAAGQVIIKVPDSAGSVGNIRLEGALLRAMPLQDLRQLLLDQLHRMGWRDCYPILVGVWDENVSHSPSVHLWIPHRSNGAPQVEGIFEQRVRGETAAFIGAARSELPASLKEQLGIEARAIARVLQNLGYFGCCSLDAVICKASPRVDVIHWIECNGRWGGVSIPMLVASRLRPGNGLPAIAIVQEVRRGDMLRTQDFRRLLADLLLPHRNNGEGLVILSPSEHQGGASVNLLAVAVTQRGADDLLAQAMQRLAVAHTGRG